MGIIMKDGHQYGVGGFLEKKAQFPSTGWSTTETVNGTTYHVQTISFTSASTDTPIVSIFPISGALPTDSEQAAYDSVAYFTVDPTNKVLKGYSKAVPANSFSVVVKGVA
jgi:hypothetical protein